MIDASDLIVDRRIARVYRDVIVPALTAVHESLAVAAWEAPGEPVPFADAAAQTYAPLELGQHWGLPWSTT
ncbi:hypothetical protein [Microbacterium tumbae]